MSERWFWFKFRVRLAWAVFRGRPVVHGLHLDGRNVYLNEGTVIGIFSSRDVNLITGGAGLHFYQRSGVTVVEQL